MCTVDHATRSNAGWPGWACRRASPRLVSSMRSCTVGHARSAAWSPRTGRLRPSLTWCAALAPNGRRVPARTDRSATSSRRSVAWQHPAGVAAQGPAWRCRGCVDSCISSCSSPPSRTASRASVLHARADASPPPATWSRAEAPCGSCSRRLALAAPTAARVPARAIARASCSPAPRWATSRRRGRASRGFGERSLLFARAGQVTRNFRAGERHATWPTATTAPAAAA